MYKTKITQIRQEDLTAEGIFALLREFPCSVLNLKIPYIGELEATYVGDYLLNGKTQFHNAINVRNHGDIWQLFETAKEMKDFLKDCQARKKAAGI